MDRKSLLLFVAALAGFLSPTISLAQIADIRGNAQVSYSQTELTIAGEKSTTWSLNQNYDLTLSKDITKTLRFFANLTYIITDTSEGDRRKNFFPQIILFFKPPRLYNLNFGFNRIQTLPSEGVGITTSHTTASFDLPQTRWPSLSITFNRTTTEDDSDPRRVDTVQNALGLRTSYEVNILETDAEFTYSFTGRIDEDKISEVEREEPTHFVGVDISRKFWQDKITVSGDLGFILTESTLESTGVPSRFETVFPPDEGLSSVGAAPLSTNGALIDGNLTSSAGIDIDDPAFQGSNIVARYNSDQALFKIHLYVNTTLTKSVIDTLAIGWELSTSNNGITFSAPQPIVPVYEEIPFKRFVFTFSERSARFFRLVNTLSPNTGLPIEVTEMEPLGFVLATPRQSFTTEQSRNFGGLRISFTPREDLTASYNVSFSRTEDITFGRDTTSIGQGANIGYEFIPEYLHISASFGTTSSETSGQEEFSNTSYALTLSSRPLPTLRANLGLRRSEGLTDGDTTSRTDSLSLGGSMSLYRGLDLSLRTSLDASKDFVNDSDTDSASFSGTIRLQPWKPLIFSANGSYTQNVTDQQGVEDTTTSESLIANVSWNITRKSYVSGRIAILPDVSQSYNFTWLPIRGMQISVRTGFAEDRENYGANINWRFLRRFNFGVGYNTTKNDATDTEINSLFARGNINF